MRKCFSALFLMLVIASCAAFPQEFEAPEGFVMIVGPRIGGAYVFDTPDNFTASLRTLYPTGSYVPAFTLFGVIAEQRILLGETKSHFAFQEVLLLGGLEQAVALPEAAFLIGYRDASGFEFGLGPIASLAGIGVVTAIGWTLSFRGVYVPIDVSVILPNATRPASVALTTGFNFRVGGSNK